MIVEVNLTRDGRRYHVEIDTDTGKAVTVKVGYDRVHRARSIGVMRTLSKSKLWASVALEAEQLWKSR